MIEIAGLVLSGLGFFKDLHEIYKDLKSWDQMDLEVDGDWLSLALKKGLLSGSEAEYYWANLRRVPTLELQGSYQVVVAHNNEKKVFYRIVQGPQHDRVVLMKKLTSE